MRTLLLALLVSLAACSGPAPPPDYGAMATPALDAAGAATTDEEKFDAILAAHDVFTEMARDIDGLDEARLAKPHLQSVADAAERLDNELKQDEDARDALLERREQDVQRAAEQLAQLLISYAFKPKELTEITDPLDTLSSTLQQ